MSLGTALPRARLASAAFAAAALAQTPLPAAAAGGDLRTLAEIGPAVAACWHAPEGLAKLERVDVTVRFSLKSDGSVFGEPRVTFVGAPLEGRVRELLTRSALAAVRDCTPLRLTGGLGQAIAGRPFAIHLIYQGPKGRGA